MDPTPVTWDRDEVAKVLERVATEGLPGPRDLDVALDAIQACITPTPAEVEDVPGHRLDKRFSEAANEQYCLGQS